MDIFEKINKTFAGWYESLFGDTVSDIRPKDVLRKIITTMEDNRKEGLDNRVYVPNKYILEIVFANEEEKEYLLAFLDKEELESALKKYMSQNKYFVRGPLDFTMEEITPEDDEPAPEKLKVKCKWDVRPVEKDEEAQAKTTIVPGLAEQPDDIEYNEEDYTDVGTEVCDASTVAPPILQIKDSDGRESQHYLTKPVSVIGRSRRLNNDLILERDGMVSKRHAEISISPEGWEIKDLNSTNGTWVNGERVVSPPGRILKSGDVIRLGSTELIFEESNIRSQAITTCPEMRPKLTMSEEDGKAKEFRLASEMIIGRAFTSDIKLDHTSVSRRHAKIYSADGSEFCIEDLGSENGSWVNEMRLQPGEPVTLCNGDKILLGEAELHYELD